MLNAQSLQAHYIDIEMDPFICQSDIIAICETHLNNDLPDAFKSYKYQYYLNKGSKGIAFLSKIKPLDVKKYDTDFCSVIVGKYEKFNIINLYRYPNRPIIDQFIQLITSLLTTNTTTIICGDINIDLIKSPNNKFTQSLTHLGFTQHVQYPTYKTGSLLDHVYISTQDDLTCEIENNHPLYFSDHDAILFLINIPQINKWNTKSDQNETIILYVSKETKGKQYQTKKKTIRKSKFKTDKHESNKLVKLVKQLFISPIQKYKLQRHYRFVSKKLITETENTKIIIVKEDKKLIIKHIIYKKNKTKTTEMNNLKIGYIISKINDINIDNIGQDVNYINILKALPQKISITTIKYQQKNINEHESIQKQYSQNEYLIYVHNKYSCNEKTCYKRILQEILTREKIEVQINSNIEHFLSIWNGKVPTEGRILQTHDIDTCQMLIMYMKEIFSEQHLQWTMIELNKQFIYIEHDYLEEKILPECLFQYFCYLFMIDTNHVKCIISKLK